MRLRGWILVAVLALFLAVGCRKEPTTERKHLDEQAQALHKAVETGDLEGVRRLLANGVDVNISTRHGTTPLHLAADFGRGAIAELLLAHGANVNAQAEFYGTPLHCAARIGAIDIARLLVAKNADIHAKADSGRTPLYEASYVKFGKIDGNRYEVAQFLIAEGACVDDKDNRGRTALHMAIKRGDVDTSELLISEGADVNLTDAEGNTCLHLATIAGQTAAAELLIPLIADIDARNNRGYTPLHCAVLNTYEGDRDPMVMLLIAKGADVNARSDSGWTALHFAARDDSVRAAELLIANGAEVNTTIGSDFTPLHTALRRERYNVAEVLIINGADTNAKDAYGKCPLDYAPADHRDNLIALIEGRRNTAVASVQDDVSVTPSPRATETHTQATDESNTHLEKLVLGNTAFALDLYEKLSSHEGNLVFSPYSVSTALAMTYAAARENTAKEMAKAMRFPLGQDDLHPAFGQLHNRLNEVQQAGNVRLHAANSLWPQLGEPLLADYLTLVKRHYGVSITPVDYRTDQTRETTRRTINS